MAFLPAALIFHLGFDHGAVFAAGTDSPWTFAHLSRWELLVEVLLVNLSQRSELADAGVGEKDVEFALLLADGLINFVDIPQARDISLDTGCRLADLANRLAAQF
jgi:hypothetical protein